MTQNLSNFFREKKERSDAETAGVDWEARRKEWIEAVNDLYKLVESFLDEPLKQGLVSLQREQKRIMESHLGIYIVDELILNVGDEKIFFSPKARSIVGGQGRVDVRGESGEGMLILQPGSRWCMVASKYPQLKLVELNGETLTEMLRGITRK